MAHIVLADDGIVFDGSTPEKGPLGGAESSFIALAEKLAARGHKVEVYNNCAGALEYKGVNWLPLNQGLPKACDLYIANRGDKLILAMPGAKKTVFWIHNPANYLLKWRYLWKLWKLKPDIIFIGDYHAGTYPAWAPGGRRIVIPYGVPALFSQAGPRTTPGPRAVFTSNPLRSLDWLLAVWESLIYPQMPGAELHVFSGPGTYGKAGDAKALMMQAVLDKALSLKDKGVVLRGPVPKAQLVEELAMARVHLYKGDINETYCLAVGEAQAMGVPGVVQPIGSVTERIVHGKTGFIEATDEGFAQAALRLLKDDALWQTLHQEALRTQSAWTWDMAAAEFEKLL